MHALTNPKAGRIGRKKNRTRRLANVRRLRGQMPSPYAKPKGGE